MNEFWQTNNKQQSNKVCLKIQCQQYKKGNPSRHAGNEVGGPISSSIENTFIYQILFQSSNLCKQNQRVVFCHLMLLRILRKKIVTAIEDSRSYPCLLNAYPCNTIFNRKMQPNGMATICCPRQVTEKLHGFQTVPSQSFPNQVSRIIFLLSKEVTKTEYFFPHRGQCSHVFLRLIWVVKKASKRSKT